MHQVPCTRGTIDARPLSLGYPIEGSSTSAATDYLGALDANHQLCYLWLGVTYPLGQHITLLFWDIGASDVLWPLGECSHVPVNKDFEARA